MTTFFAGDLLTAAALEELASRDWAPALMTSDSSTFTNTAESGALLSITGTVISGRTYMIEFYGAVSSASAGNAVMARLREDSATGNQLEVALCHVGNTTTIGYECVIRVPYTASSSGSKTFVLTGQTYIGTGNSNFRAAAAGANGRVSSLTVRRMSP